MKMTPFLLFSLIFLIGCGKSSDDQVIVVPIAETQEVETGKTITVTFVDSVVEGMTYKGMTSKKRGLTNADGELECEAGEEVEFSIGKLILGRGVCAKNMNPESLVEDKYLALKIGYALIRLDYNGDADDGIKIPETLRDQDLLEGDLADIQDLDADFDTLEAMITQITENAPANSFFNLLKENGIDLQDVRDHYKVTFVPMGIYQGEVTKLTVNLPEGECNARKFLRVSVGPKNITFPGFAGLNPEELSLSVPRKINSSRGRNTFKKTIDLVGFVSPDSDEIQGARLYERAIISGRIFEGKMTANFKLGTIGDDGKLVPSCAGKLVLNKVEKEPLFYKVERLSLALGGQIASVKAMANAADYGTDIYSMAVVASDAFLPYYDCVSKNNITEENSYICTDLKTDLDQKVNELAEYILARKFSNPLISDQLVSEAVKAAKMAKRLNPILFP